MIFRVFFTTCAISLVMAGFAADASACKCKPRTKAEVFDSSKIAFWGEVVESGGDEVVFKVASAFRGTKRKRKVRFETNTTSCGIAFEEGANYIIYGAGKRDKKTKRYPGISQCSLSQRLDEKPISAMMWTLADQPQWGLTAKENKKFSTLRDKLTDRANRALDKALKACDKPVWRSKKKASGNAVVRFDYTEKRRFDVEVLKYTSSSGDEDVAECLDQKLDGTKFPKFPGGRVSIRAYRVVDRIDSTMVRTRGSSTVVDFKSDSADAESE